MAFNELLRATILIVSKSDGEIKGLLKEIEYAATLIGRCRENSTLNESMQEEIRNATELIWHASEVCAGYFGSSRFRKFLRASRTKDKLHYIKEKISSMLPQFSAVMGVVNILSAVGNDLSSDYSWRHYPEHAVGIEEKVGEVINLLEWESDKKAIAVVLHGVPGMGKTTLADAVYSIHSVEGCRYSRIGIFKNIESTLDIIELQKLILKDLMGSKEIPDIRKPEEGQLELARILQQHPTFIYIDNVLGRDDLPRLLPHVMHMNKAKKVRVLITALDGDVGSACPMNTTPRRYEMKGILDQYAKILFNENMFDDMREKLTDKQVDYIIGLCAGNPSMLIKVAKALSFEEDTQKVYVSKSINQRSMVHRGKNKEN